MGTAFETVQSLVGKLPVIEYLEKNIDGFVTDIHNALDATLTAEQTAIARAAAALVSELAAKVSEDAAKVSELAAAQSAADSATSMAAAQVSEAAAQLSERNADLSTGQAADHAAAADAARLAALLSEAHAGISETNASAAAAAALVSQNASAQSETNANAARDAAALSATASQTAKTAAESARDAADASKVSAATHDTSAGVSATNAHTSELASAASATAADASKTAAAGSAATATTQAGISTTNATAAATSAAQLAAALLSFNKLWLGPHASDPTLDNNGQPLVEGAQYENTSTTPAKIRIYHNGAWQDSSADAEAATASAQASATAASGSAGAASTSQGAAATSAGQASTSAGNASASATLAQNWASQTAGLVGGVDYSARYYASQASTSAASAAASAAAAAAASFTSDINLNTHKVTNLAAGTVATDGVNKSQLDAVNTTAGTKVPLDGSTPMTGDLIINKTSPYIWFKKAGVLNWGFGYNDGSTVVLNRYNTSTGAFIDTPWYVNAANGQTVMSVRPSWGGVTPIDTGNAASTCVSYAANRLRLSAGGGSDSVWNYAAQGGQPTYLWGTNDGVNCYVWNPSNFSVNYANSCYNASGLVSGNRFTFSWDGGAGHINMFIDGGLVAYVASNLSDMRLKESVVLNKDRDALSLIKAIKFYSYDWKAEGPREAGHEESGFIAQQLRGVSPRYVYEPPQGEDPMTHPIGVNEQNLLRDALRAIQQLSAEVEALKAQLNTH
jgi:hypothetical protein